MTKLLVEPIDPTKPGSYRARKQFMGLARRLDAIRQRGDGEVTDWHEVVDAFDAMEALLLPRLSTDDGTTVEAALDQLSAEEFDGLLSWVTFGAEVPPESASSLSLPSVDGASPPTG